jgi:predicted Zn-dependent protease
MQRIRLDDEQEVRANLFDALVANARYDEAEQVLQKLSVRNAVNTVSNRLRAKLLLAKGEAQAALTEVQPDIEMGNSDGIALAAKANLALGNGQKALELINAAMKRNWLAGEWLLTAGNAEAKRGNLAQAKAAWTDCIFYEGHQTTSGKSAAEMLAKADTSTSASR